MAKAKGGKRPGAGGAKKSKWITLDMPNKLELVEGWARDGATDTDICNGLGISAQTLYTWKGKYPEFAQAIQKGKEIIDIQVENALLKRALGYKYDEVHFEPQPVIFEGKVKLDEFGAPIIKMQPIKKVIKEVLPDTTAQIFWLKNRKPHVWRDRKHVEANVTTKGFDYMSDEELEAEIARMDDNE
jgi:hypothetical protein